MMNKKELINHQLPLSVRADRCCNTIFANLMHTPCPYMGVGEAKLSS